jgi:condensation domain-containing protein
LKPIFHSTFDPLRCGSVDQQRAQVAELLNSRKEQPVLPASIAQQGLWFLAQLEPDTAAYNISVGLRLKGSLRPEVLERSLQAIISRHESLRTNFVLRNNELLQLISPITRFQLQVIDLSSCPESQIETEVHSRALREVQGVFDLTRGPLFRIAVFKLRPDDHVLICVMHHIISDGWSTEIFVQELASNYPAFSTDMGYRPEPLHLQYGDYCIWQRESSHGESFQRQLKYWKQKLAGSPALLELPSDHPRPAERTSRGRTQTIALDPTVVKALNVIAQNNEATFFMLTLAAFGVLLYRYSGQTDILIGVPAAGRHQIETEFLIGLFVNTVVLRIDLSGNPRFSTLLVQVRNTMLEALANQDVPFERVVEELKPVRSLSHNPVFQVMFATFRESVRSRSFGDLVATPYVINTATSRFDLSSALIEGADGNWWFKLEYDTALFDDDRITRMLGHYQQLLHSIAHSGT